MTGFLGPNGAGKSTTMRVMVGLTAPTSGSELLRDTAEQALGVLMRRGMFPEDREID